MTDLQFTEHRKEIDKRYACTSGHHCILYSSSLYFRPYWDHIYNILVLLCTSGHHCILFAESQYCEFSMRVHKNICCFSEDWNGTYFCHFSLPWIWFRILQTSRIFAHIQTCCFTEHSNCTCLSFLSSKKKIRSECTAFYRAQRLYHLFLISSVRLILVLQLSNDCTILD